MKILLHDYPGHPFQVQLSRQLAKRGHTVKHLYAGYNQTPRGTLEKQAVDPDTFSINPVYIREPLNKYNFVKRWLQEREYGQLLVREIADFTPDVLISANTPLDAQKAILQASKKRDIVFIFWLQDVIGIASHKLLQQRIPFVGDWIGRYYIAIEKNLLHRSHHVVAITQDFLPLLQEWQVNASNITVIPNWAPLDTLPVHPKENPWAREHGLAEAFCFMYTGTLGMKHDPNQLLQLATKYQNQQNVKIVVISEGPGANWLAKQKANFGLQNLLLMGYQPFEQLPDVMGAADVLITLLEPEAGVFSVPSKVLSYLCAQRPVLAAIPPENLAAKIIMTEKAGIVVHPEKKSGFLDGADQLLQNPLLRSEMGKNARAYAETHFDIREIGDQFETILQKVTI